MPTVFSSPHLVQSADGLSFLDVSKIIYWSPDPADATNSVLVRGYDSAVPFRLSKTAFEAAKQASISVSDGTSNFASVFREAFESYAPNTATGRWTEVKASGDIIQIDGNTAGASYLVISKDPLTAGSVSYIQSVANFTLPLDIGVGLHRSQAQNGIEFSTEIIDTGTPITTPADLTISTIQQATTTLTVTTTTAHGLVPGKRIQIYGVADSRFNYPALVVATVTSSTVFTCTAGPAGTIPSVTAGPFASGFVSYRLGLMGAPNGTSMIFENATATEASFYIRSEAGDLLPSGTVNGKQSITIGTTASVAALSGNYVYAWQPTNQYRLDVKPDRVQWIDTPVDSSAQPTQRVGRDQVVPSTLVPYAIRFRATSSRGLTIPIAKVVSISKAGSTTWTVTTDVAHGLTTSDLVVLYGNRDTTNFPNVTAATAVSAVLNSTQFQLVSTTGTATDYGGTVYRVQGGNLPVGIATMVGVSVQRTSGIVTATVSASFSGASVGDYINLHGWRSSVDGSDLGFDGPYRIQQINAAVLTLEPIGSTAASPDTSLLTGGGAVLKRTDLRISWARVFDYERLRVEALGRPSGDLGTAFPVVLQGGTTAVTGTVTATVTGYPTAAAAADAYANPTITHIGADNMAYNGTTWDRVRSGSSAADGVSTVATGNLNTLGYLMGFNGTTWDRVRSGSNAADGLATVATGNANVSGYTFLFNGTTWDRARNNWNVATGDTGAKTTTGNGATQTNYDALGAVITIIMGTVSGTTPTFVGQIQMSQDSGTTWVSVPGATTASITASGNYTLTIYPGATVVANQSVSLPLPRTWRLQWTIGGTTPSFTITSVNVSYIRG